jgi:hypothetical protein
VLVWVAVGQASVGNLWMPVGLGLGFAAVVADAMSGPVPLICLPLAVLLFPDGKLPSRRWR